MKPVQKSNEQSDVAGDWIKVEVSLPDKPEVWQIAEILGIDSDAVVGKLIRMWSWFDAHTETGNAKGVTPALLDRLTFVTGFAEAMIEVGWLEHHADGLVQVNFDKHTGASAKKRAETSRRVAKHRHKKVKRGCNEKDVTETLPEKKREENISNKEKESKKKKTAARRTRLPTDWTLTQKLREYCQEKRPDLDPDDVAEGFKLYWWSDGRVKANWDLTFMNWVRNQKVNYGNKQKPETAVQTRERRNREALERAEKEGNDRPVA